MKKIFAAYRSYWADALNFRGRTSRAGYWLAVLAGVIVSLPLDVVSVLFNLDVGEEASRLMFQIEPLWDDFVESPDSIILPLFWITVAWEAANVLPSLSMSVRRLHDTGRSAKYLLMPGIPMALMFLILFVEIFSNSSEQNGLFVFVTWWTYIFAAIFTLLLALRGTPKEENPFGDRELVFGEEVRELTEEERLAAREARQQKRKRARPFVFCAVVVAAGLIVLCKTMVAPAMQYGEFKKLVGFDPPGSRTGFEMFETAQPTGGMEAYLAVQYLEWESLYSATYRMDPTEFDELKELLSGYEYFNEDGTYLGRSYVHHMESCEAFQIRVSPASLDGTESHDVTITVYSGGAYFENGKRWVVTYGGNLSETFRGVVEAEDGSFIAVGTASSFNGDLSLPILERDLEEEDLEYDAMVARVSADGELLYMKKLGLPANSVLLAVTRMPEGDFIAVGRQVKEEAYDPDNSDFLIVQFDIDGEIIWADSIAALGLSRFKAVTALADGGFAAAGSQEDTPVIAAFDADGKLRWIQRYIGVGIGRFNAIAEADDGGLVAAGSCGSNYYDALLVKTDSAGTKEWVKRWSGALEDHFYALTKAPDGTFLAAGGTRSTNSGDFSSMGGNRHTDAFAVRFDQQGKVAWERLYGGDRVDWFFSAFPKPDGGFVLAGSTSSETGEFAVNPKSAFRDWREPDLLIASIDDNGDLEWYRCFGDTDVAFATSVILASTGRIVAAGSSSGYKNLPYSRGILRNYYDLNHEYYPYDTPPGDITYYEDFGDCLIVSYDPEADSP
ncbi:MAG: DUF805 domain-containing protein [Clostridiales Family XIII bacterium]|nr:DUF805 domain-containing protein [Clostridiales Family XIII bacterium]